VRLTVDPFETSDIAAYCDVKASLAAKNLAPPVRAASARVVNAAGQFDDVATIGEQMEAQCARRSSAAAA